MKIRRNKELNAETRRRREIKDLMLLALGMAGLFFWWKPSFFLYAAVVIALGVVIRPWGKVVLFVWGKCTQALAWFNSKVILSLVYVVLLIPAGLLLRLFKGDPMHIRSAPEESLFESVDHTYQAEDLEKMW